MDAGGRGIVVREVVEAGAVVAARMRAARVDRELPRALSSAAVRPVDSRSARNKRLQKN